MKNSKQKIFMTMLTLALSFIATGFYGFSAKAACTHPYTQRRIIDATCTTKKTIETFCVSCNEMLGSYTEGSPLGHSFEWITTITPTCYSGGHEDYKCTRCDHVANGHNLDATGKHNWKEYTSSNPTCTSDGEKKYKCGNSGCTAEKTEKNGNRLGHDYEWKTTTKPTCGTGGKEEYICKRCKHVGDGHKLDATGKHKWKLTSTEKPTCTTAEIKNYKCTVCSKTKKEKGDPKLGHDYETKITDPTCEKEGKKEKKCKVCGYAPAGESSKPLGHLFAKATCTEPKHCTRKGCEKTEGKKLGHSWTEATYTQKATCSRCKETKGNTLPITVIYDCNNIEVESIPANSSVYYNKTYGTLPTPVAKNKNFKFDGWYTSANSGSKISAKSVVPASSNIKLYAHWKTKLQGGFVEIGSMDYFPYDEPLYNKLFHNPCPGETHILGLEHLHKSNPNLYDDKTAKRIKNEALLYAQVSAFTLAGENLIEYFNLNRDTNNSLGFGAHPERVDAVIRNGEKCLKSSTKAYTTMLTSFSSTFSAGMDYVYNRGNIKISGAPNRNVLGLSFKGANIDLALGLGECNTGDSLELSFDGTTYTAHYIFYIYDYYDYNYYDSSDILTLNTDELHNMNLCGMAKNYMNVYKYETTFSFKSTGDPIKDREKAYYQVQLPLIQIP